MCLVKKICTKNTSHLSLGFHVVSDLGVQGRLPCFTSFSRSISAKRWSEMPNSKVYLANEAHGPRISLRAMVGDTLHHLQGFFRAVLHSNR